MMKEMRQVKEVLISEVKSMVHSLMPNYFVEIYGSHATGLCLHWSDIDLVIGPSNPDSEQPASSLQQFKVQDSKLREAMRKLADCLRGEKAQVWVTNVLHLDSATVPVIKLKISLRQLMI